MHERRRFPRKAVDVFLNKFIGGHPHLCRAVDISERGIKVVTYHEPKTHMRSFPLEIRLPGDSETFWLWARRVSEQGRRQVLEFIAPTPADAHRLARFMATYEPTS